VCEIVRLKNGTYGVSIYPDILIKLDYMEMNFILIHKQSQKIFVNVSGEHCGTYGNFRPIFRITLEYIKKNT